MQLRGGAASEGQGQARPDGTREEDCNDCKAHDAAARDSRGCVLAAALTAAVFAFTTNGSAAREASGTLVVNINTGPATIDPRDMTSFFDTIGLNFYVDSCSTGRSRGRPARSRSTRST